MKTTIKWFTMTGTIISTIVYALGAYTQMLYVQETIDRIPTMTKYYTDMCSKWKLTAFILVCMIAVQLFIYFMVNQDSFKWSIVGIILNIWNLISLIGYIIAAIYLSKPKALREKKELEKKLKILQAQNDIEELQRKISEFDS